jgi:hypothetical protein
MAPVHGDRFNNWYLFKTYLRDQDLPIGHKTLGSYQFALFDYKYRFIMPKKIQFSAGTITYDDAQRLFGVFRFPRNAQGDFFTPLSVAEIQKKIDAVKNLTQEEVDKLLELSSPVVFQAFKIPRYGFEYIDVSDFNIKEISNQTDPEFAASLKNEFNRILEGKISDVKQKISSSPNYLLILENTLNKELKNFDEIATMSNEIIHI